MSKKPLYYQVPLLTKWLHTWRALLIKNHSGWSVSLAWYGDRGKEKMWQHTTSLAERMCWEVSVCDFHQIRPCRFRDLAVLPWLRFSCGWTAAFSSVLHWCASTSKSTLEAMSCAPRQHGTQSGSDWKRFQVVIKFYDTKKKKSVELHKTADLAFALR